MNQTLTKVAKGSKVSLWSFRLAAIGILFVVIGLIGGTGTLSPLVAMLMLTLGLLTLIVGGICGAIGLLRSNGTGGDTLTAMPWSATLLGVAALVTAGLSMSGSGGAPIHDISTDTEDPPQFIAVAELRGPKDNPVEYAGAETAALQIAAYPDIKTLVFANTPAVIFDTALATAVSMGWEIIASDINTGHIEATATTPYVGFKDDVVIRVRARDGETLVDVRSKSRFGRGDMGVNAKRIREYSDKLLTQVKPEA
jgi:uncharacterized protein (DUF1499 family)